MTLWRAAPAPDPRYNAVWRELSRHNIGYDGRVFYTHEGRTKVPFAEGTLLEVLPRLPGIGVRLAVLGA